MPVFLEQEENRSEELLPANKNSIRSSFQCHGVKHRTGRAPVAHRRSWSVGGSNVHQTMMRRSEPHLHRLDLTQDTIQEKDRRSPLVIGPALIESREEQDRRRGSILVDAETQTDVRSKGDGISIDSPTVHLKNVNAAGAFESSDSEESENNSFYQWERKRGRASGSSQQLSLNETSSHSLPAGRRYTVDMRQWKYNDSWNKHAQASLPLNCSEDTEDKCNTLPARMDGMSLYSSWETCSDSEEEREEEEEEEEEKEKNVPDVLSKGSSSSLRRNR